MSTLNIAIAGGVVLLILVLLKLRRAGADEPKAPGRGRSRVRGERRRRRGKDAPPAPPEPMPLAAAAGESAATAEADTFAPPAAEWPPADEPAPAPWPPAAEEEPVEWPDAEAPVAPEPYAVEDEEPVAGEPAPAPAPAPAPEAHVWADDEIVTEPGWPMPGEVDDVAWTPPPVAEAIPLTTAEPAGPAWQEEAATAAPERFEWLGETEDEQGIPAWDPAPAEAPASTPWEEPADEAAAPAESFAWAPPEEAAPVWEAPAEEPSAWDYAGEPVEDVQPTGPIAIPVVEEPAEAFAPAETFAPVESFEPAETFAPAESFAPAENFEAAEEFAPVAGFEPVEAVAEVEQFAPEALDGPFSAPESFEQEIAAFDVPAFVPEAGEGDAPLRAEDGVAAEPVPVPAADAPAWWDEIEEPQPVAAPAPAALADDPARTGRFALGGFAVQPGQQALGGVSFRAEIDDAPAAWSVSAGDAEDAPAGTIVLQLDGAINCTPDDLEVVMEPGFAPTTQGFTVRVAALAPGPFAASGTFRVG